MSNAPHGLQAIIAFYGNPTKNGALDHDWYKNNIVSVQLPPGMYLKLAWDNTQVVRSVQIHRKCADSLGRIFTQIWNKIRLEQKAKYPGRDTPFYDGQCNSVLRSLGLDQFGGSFNYRPIRGRSQLSCHAFGCALDLAPDGNQLGATHGTMPQWVVDLFKAEGWTWGGDFKNRRDFMHFQFCSGY